MALIRYGGSVTDSDDEKAFFDCAKKNFETGNWQQGVEGDLMEKEAAQALGVNHCVLTSSGTTAGILALAALELPKGSEVIIPATTFPTIFNIIVQQGFKPVVVDSKIGTYNMDVDEVEKAISPKTKAIIAVHALGNPVDMPRLMQIAKKHNVYVIEDNCDGWGTTINGQPVGSFGDVSITSFHAAHIVSMGVGGGVFTDNEELAKKVRMYRDWGRHATTKEAHGCETLPKDYDPRFVYDKIGYNFQILEVQAAMGRAQLKKAGAIKEARKNNFMELYQRLSKFPDIILPKWSPMADICWFAFPISVKGDRALLLKHLEEREIETRPMFTGNILRHPAYKNVKVRKMKLKDADWITEHSFWISCHPRLTQEDRDYIVKAFEDYYAGIA